MAADPRYYNYCAGENHMVDTQAIKNAMREKGIEQKPLADELGVSHHTLINRLRFANWTVLEAYRLCEILGLDFVKVFFAHPEEARLGWTGC